MQKFAIAIGLLLSILLLTGTTLRAEVDIPWQLIHQEEIYKTVKAINELLAPVGAKAGFPDRRPAFMKNASYEQLYNYAAGLSHKGSLLMSGLLRKNRFPIKIELGARYFVKRLEIGAGEFSEKTGSERIFEFLCRDFASACDLGLDEMARWASPESVFTMEHFWHKNICDGLTAVKARLPLIPVQIDDEEAQQTWKRAASALVSAGNQAGMTASRVGGFDFPAYRLHFAVKYFKAASKAAVVDKWYTRKTSPEFWVEACKKLRDDISGIADDIDALLNSLVVPNR